jgi:hypothetical protein
MPTKLCSNGHVIDDATAFCPYCPRPPIPPTKMAIPAATAASGRAAHRPTQAFDVSSPLFGWVVALNGEHAGQAFELRSARVMIGKDPVECQVTLKDAGISTKHAEIFYVAERKEWCLEDLRSTNGTFLNDRVDRIDAREAIVDNDCFRVGKVRLIFKALPHSALSLDG